jgi:hypothetical protein
MSFADWHSPYLKRKSTDIGDIPISAYATGFSPRWPNPNQGYAMVKPAEQAKFLEAESEIFIPIKGVWGPACG